jgi:hypothetical protein
MLALMYFKDAKIKKINKKKHLRVYSLLFKRKKQTKCFFLTLKQRIH